MANVDMTIEGPSGNKCIVVVQSFHVELSGVAANPGH